MLSMDVTSESFGMLCSFVVHSISTLLLGFPNIFSRYLQHLATINKSLRLKALHLLRRPICARSGTIPLNGRNPTGMPPTRRIGL